MQLLIILIIVLPVASATPVFPVVRPFIPDGLNRAVSLPDQFDTPSDTIIIGPIPTGWHFTHKPSIHNKHPFNIGPTYKSDGPLDGIDTAQNLARAANDYVNVVATPNTKDNVLVTPELGPLLPPSPIRNAVMCQKLCSMHNHEPCGPCEDLSNTPDATLSPPNAERTESLSLRAATTQEDRAWLPLWRCLIQCIRDRESRCEMCNDYWTFYQQSMPPDAYEDPGMKSYIEMTRCLAACGRGTYGIACERCERQWSVWEEKLSQYIGPRSLGGVVKREPFREDTIGLTLYGCLKGCDPERPESPEYICERCRKMVSMFPPVYLHNWAIERPILKPDYYNSVTTGPGPSSD